MEDLRIRYTKSILIKSLLEMIKIIPLYKITVTQLCKKAQINRSTFYTYYKDVYDLYEKIEDNFIEELYKLNTPVILPYDEKSQREICHKLCKFFYDNKDVFLVLAGPNGKFTFLHKFTNRILIWVNQITLVEEIGFKRNEQKMALVYFYNGSMGSFYEWLSSENSMNIEEMSDLLWRLNFRGIPSAQSI